MYVVLFFCKHRTAYALRMSDWSSDVCSSYLDARLPADALLGEEGNGWQIVQAIIHYERIGAGRYEKAARALAHVVDVLKARGEFDDPVVRADCAAALRSEEHTSELKSLMRISYAVFCLTKKQNIKNNI